MSGLAARYFFCRKTKSTRIFVYVTLCPNICENLSVFNGGFGDVNRESKVFLKEHKGIVQY